MIYISVADDYQLNGQRPCQYELFNGIFLVLVTGHKHNCFSMCATNQTATKLWQIAFPAGCAICSIFSLKRKLRLF